MTCNKDKDRVIAQIVQTCIIQVYKKLQHGSTGVILDGILDDNKERAAWVNYKYLCVCR